MAIPHDAITGIEKVAGKTAAPGIIDSGDVAPTDASVKLGHHAVDHNHKGTHHHAAHADGAKRKTFLSPFSHAWEKAKDVALSGGGMLALFSLLFIGIKEGIGWLANSIMDGHIESFWGHLATALPAAALAGAVWYGAKEFIKHYNAAHEHNESLRAEITHGIGHAMEKTKGKEREIEQVSAIGDIATHGIEVSIHHNQDRPAFLSNILENGPKSISPKEIAQRIATERTANLDASRG